MEIKIVLITLVFCCTACVTEYRLPNAAVERSLVGSAISLCLEKYEEKAGKPLLAIDEVDRAYVHSSADLRKLDVLFARDEVGSFGKRSENYRPFQRCSIKVGKNNVMNVIYLGGFGIDSLIDDGDIDSFDMKFYDGTVREYLFEVVDNKFKQVKSKVLILE